jgi:glycine/D-amino acid oxidase-like deaminating enzyme
MVSPVPSLNLGMQGGTYTLVVKHATLSAPRVGGCCLALMSHFGDKRLKRPQTARGSRRMASDVLIVGGGHNGLVCAFYLARAGLKVTVLERRNIVGGAAVTETFHPGFRNSVASYTVSLLNPRVIADLELARHGLKILNRPYANFLPTDDGRSLLTGGGVTPAEVAKFSAKDAAALPAYEAALETIDAAVNRARQCNVSGVVVVGHTDTSGSTAYNQGLSERRASVVRDALVARGIATGSIQAQARGETDLARATRDGVREPMNRRSAVTIRFR